jgi:hypothetical protein
MVLVRRFVVQGCCGSQGMQIAKSVAPAVHNGKKSEVRLDQM